MMDILISLFMISNILQSELCEFYVDLLGLKIPKFFKFNLITVILSSMVIMRLNFRCLHICIDLYIWICSVMNHSYPLKSLFSEEMTIEPSYLTMLMASEEQKSYLNLYESQLYVIH